MAGIIILHWIRGMVTLGKAEIISRGKIVLNVGAVYWLSLVKILVEESKYELLGLNSQAPLSSLEFSQRCNLFLRSTPLTLPPVSLAFHDAVWD